LHVLSSFQRTGISAAGSPPTTARLTAISSSGEPFKTIATNLAASTKICENFKLFRSAAGFLETCRRPSRPKSSAENPVSYFRSALSLAGMTGRTEQRTQDHRLYRYRLGVSIVRPKESGFLFIEPVSPMKNGRPDLSGRPRITEKPPRYCTNATILPVPAWPGLPS